MHCFRENRQQLFLALSRTLLAVAILMACSGCADDKSSDPQDCTPIIGIYDGDVTSTTILLHPTLDIDSGWVELDSLLNPQECGANYRLIVRGRGFDHNCEPGQPCTFDTLVVWDTGVNLVDTVLSYECVIGDIHYEVSGRLSDGLLQGSAISIPTIPNGPSQGCCEHQVTFSVTRKAE